MLDPAFARSTQEHPKDWYWAANIGIDDIEEQLSTPTPLSTPEAIETVPASRDFPAVSTPTRVGPTGPASPQSPIPPNELEIEFLPKATNVPPWLLKPKDARWKDVQTLNKKFVDDGLHMSVVNMRAEPLLEQNGLLYKETKAPEAQQMLEHLTRRATERGMVVNEKMAVMCVSGAKTFEAQVSLEGRNGQIKVVNKIKFLGITLDNDCSFESHVQNLRTSVRRRSWALTKLKRRGMNNEQLKKVYTSMIRPSVKYASVAWHSMLTKEQANILEGQQVQCLKKILGPGTSARRMRQVLQIEPLYERREKAVVKFGQKCLKSDCFRQWYPREPSHLMRGGPM